MNEHYIRHFLDECSWFAHDRQDELVAGASEPASNTHFRPTEQFITLFPELTALLSAATITPVSLGQDHWLLYGWPTEDGYTAGWLCDQPRSAGSPSLFHPDHRVLLSAFGGIRESWNCEVDLMLSQNFVFAESLCLQGFGSANETIIMDRYAEADHTLPIALSDFVTFAVEANGNATGYNKETGEVVLCAHDHAFDYATPFGGAPDYTLYQIDGASNFREWTELLAKNMRTHLGV